MSYNVHIEKKADHIRAELSGQREPGKELENAVGVLTRLTKLCVESGMDKVLVIIDLEGDFPMVSAFQLGEDPSSFGWEPSVRIAAVDLNENSRKMLDLTASIANNRGCDVSVFDQEAPAMAWLLGT